MIKYVIAGFANTCGHERFTVLDRFNRLFRIQSGFNPDSIRPIRIANRIANQCTFGDPKYRKLIGLLLNVFD